MAEVWRAITWERVAQLGTYIGAQGGHLYHTEFSATDDHCQVRHVAAGNMESGAPLGDGPIIPTRVLAHLAARCWLHPVHEDDRREHAAFLRRAGYGDLLDALMAAGDPAAAREIIRHRFPVQSAV